MTAPRTRLAPSPTGALHLGNARTFLLNWLWARASGATVVLRVEDLDGPRVRAGAVEEALRDLRWLGLDWDEGPFTQSDRAAHYAAALERLRASGLAYPCVCTRKEVELAASAPNEGDEPPPYPGTCRRRFRDGVEAQASSGRAPAWRFLVPKGEVTFTDLCAGPQRWDVATRLGDFVIAKATGEAAYQLAVVVDDAAMGITHVFRGDDLLASTPRQLLLYAALGLAEPAFGHLPLVTGTDGRRLAKRHGDTRVSSYREAKIPVERMLGLLGFWGGLLPERREAGLDELRAAFSLERVPPGRVVYGEADERFLLSRDG